MPEPRRSPDDYLVALSADENASPDGRVRGTLRVYLGMCPGVGKTFAMLDDARRAHATGRPLLVGVVETHGRAETAALLDSPPPLPVLPRRLVAHRETTLAEFDLAAALTAQTPLVLVDELAHTNAPGSLHPKRWQDVRELLDAGIDVWTTVNIQHLESLRDAVSAITGIIVHETIPDAFLDRAAEVRVIDLPPDQLRERLAAGKIYLGERAAAASEGFFREGNLRALRELALRFTARKADAQKRAFMRRNLVDGPWRSGERLLVAVGPGPHAERLVRLTRRLADAHEATWIAAHVETGAALDDAAHSRLATHLALARSLGAEIISISETDPVRGLLSIARREHVTQIVAGKSTGRRAWLRLPGRDIADRLQRESGELALLLVHPGPDSPVSSTKRAPRRPETALPPVALADLRLAAITLLVTTLTGFVLETWIGHRSVALLYLLGVVFAGLSLSRPAVLALAVLSGFTWNFFFTTPRLTFAMLETGDSVLLLTLLGVALVIGHLTARVRAQAAASREGEERARALYQLTRVTSASTSLAEAAPAALRQIETVFRAPATLLLPEENNTLSVHSGPALEPAAFSVAQWAFDHAAPAGRTSDTLPESSVLALPLLITGRAAGVLALRPSDAALASPLLRDLLDTFATHLCVLLEKEAYQRSAREARVADETRRFQRALLDHVSHEIKTPVAVVQSATQHLLTAPNAPETPELLRELESAARRLDRVFTQLVTLSRAESGLIQPRPELCDAADLLREVAEAAGLPAACVEADDITFRTDADLLRTALLNLAQNARQHGDGATSVRLSARRELFGADEIVFRVTNSGAPIPPAEQPRLFDRFARGTEARPGGLGLGLPIAREFTRMLGGDLRLESSDAQATIFALRLPANS